MKGRTASSYARLTIAALAAVAAAAHGQPPLDADGTGRTAQSAVGQVGQRQTQDVTAPKTGLKPTGRINSRIQNRVQSRIRNRIDQDYDPQGNAADPFRVAEDQTRTGGRPR